MPIETDTGHADPAQLHHDIRAFAYGFNSGAPLGYDLVVSVGVGSGPIHSADVVQHDSEIRYLSGEIG